MNSVTSTPLNNDYYTGYAVFLAFCLDFQHYSKVFLGFRFWKCTGIIVKCHLLLLLLSTKLGCLHHCMYIPVSVCRFL